MLANIRFKGLIKALLDSAGRNTMMLCGDRVPEAKTEISHGF